jgi:hypothetical protein
MAYFAGLLGDFDRYLARGDDDLLRDQVSYRLAAGDGFDRAFGAAGDAAVLDRIRARARAGHREPHSKPIRFCQRIPVVMPGTW